MPAVTISLVSTLLMRMQSAFYGRVIRDKGISPNSRVPEKDTKIYLKLPGLAFLIEKILRNPMGHSLPGSIQSFVGRELCAWVALLRNRG